MQILSTQECSLISAGLSPAVRIGLASTMAVSGIVIFAYTSIYHDDILASIPKDASYGAHLVGIFLTPLFMLSAALYILDDLPQAPQHFLPH